MDGISTGSFSSTGDRKRSAATYGSPMDRSVCSLRTTHGLYLLLEILCHFLVQALKQDSLLQTPSLCLLQGGGLGRNALRLGPNYVAYQHADADYACPGMGLRFPVQYHKNLRVGQEFRLVRASRADKARDQVLLRVFMQQAVGSGQGP